MYSFCIVAMIYTVLLHRRYRSILQGIETLQAIVCPKPGLFPQHVCQERRGIHCCCGGKAFFLACFYILSKIYKPELVAAGVFHVVDSVLAVVAD